MKAVIFSFAVLMYVVVFGSYSKAELMPCPVPNKENATLVPHPDNCEHYFACETGEHIPMKCPKGLHFNPVLSVCDWPWQANCTATP